MSKKKQMKEIEKTTSIEELKKIKAKPLFKINDSNRLRLFLENNVNITDCELRDIEIEGLDIRTKSFDGSVIENCTFKNVIMQGCNFLTTKKFKNNKFFNCDLRWSSFGENENSNEYFNTRK
jgi:uncharacterized protein YjbI with pentapeptide repeats